MNYHHLLVIRSGQPENVYGRFTLELLKAEGLMGFEAIDLSEQPVPELTAAHLIVFTRCSLTHAETERLLDGISHGASVVFLQPPQRLMERLGAAPAHRVIYPAVVNIRDGYPGSGLPIQTHLPIPVLNLADSPHHWQMIAEAVPEDWSHAGHPAVAQTRIGRGQIACFFYDLAEAVARIRFGNPRI